MFSISIFGSNKVDGSTLELGESVMALVIFGGIELDFASRPPPPGVEVHIISIFGGAELKVRPHQVIRLSGFSIFGGREVEPLQLPPPTGTVDEDDEEPLEIIAYSMFGGVNVRRDGAGEGGAGRRG